MPAKKEIKEIKKITGMGAGVFVPAGIFLGLGFGLLFNNPGVGVLLGLGAGFLAMAVAKIIRP